jgi:hypothetical protein
MIGFMYFVKKPVAVCQTKADCLHFLSIVKWALLN